jgi:hypothetical protein
MLFYTLGKNQEAQLPQSIIYTVGFFTTIFRRKKNNKSGSKRLSKLLSIFFALQNHPSRSPLMERLHHSLNSMYDNF